MRILDAWLRGLPHFVRNITNQVKNPGFQGANLTKRRPYIFVTYLVYNRIYLWNAI